MRSKTSTMPRPEVRWAHAYGPDSHYAISRRLNEIAHAWDHNDALTYEYAAQELEEIAAEIRERGGGAMK